MFGVIVVGALVIWAFAAAFGDRNHTTRNSTPKQAKTSTSAYDKNPLNAEELNGMAAAIQLNGYTCRDPQRGHLWGDGVRGMEFRVQCENYKTYKVTVTPDNRFLVEPF